jgi:hypothetical protein
MANPWLIHVSQFRKSHSNMAYKDVLKEAAKTYTKVGKTKTKKTMKTSSRMVGRGLGDDILSDIKEAKLGSKAVDYIKNKVEQGGYGKRTKKIMMM